MPAKASFTATEARCSACRRWLPRSAFAKNASRHRGLQSECRECFASRHQKHDPLRNRKQHVRRHYGLEWEQYVAMYEGQGGQCLICEAPILLYERDKLRVAHVDHDHETGEVRGLLCHGCNAGIGYLRDSPRLLGIASWYLVTSGSPDPVALVTSDLGAEEHW